MASNLINIKYFCTVCEEELLESDGIHTAYDGSNCHDYCCNVCQNENLTNEAASKHITEGILHMPITEPIVVEYEPDVHKLTLKHPGTYFVYTIPYKDEYLSLGVRTVADELLKDLDPEETVSEQYEAVFDLAVRIMKRLQSYLEEVEVF